MAFAAAGQASAQETSVSEIVVTGSRIPQPNLTSTSPLTVVAEQELKLQGTTNVETLLQNLPSVVPEMNQGVDNGATGTATVSLRGLGSQRTLVLVNGNRLMPGDPIVPSPDLNNIPSALVDHVEVVTGGASAVYGSDAVAGVVNFIMKKDFEGVQIDGQMGFALHHNGDTATRGVISDFNATHAGNEIPLPGDQIDAETYDASIIFGVNSPDGKGNVTAYATYRNLQPLSQDRRDAGACGISTVDGGTGVYDTHVCQGSGSSAFGRFDNFGVADNPNGTNTFVPYTGTYAFNFGPYNYYQEHDTRYTGGYFAHYEANPALDLYSSLMFADDSQVSNAAPSGLFFTNGPIHAINCANPLMSAAQAAVICGPDAPDNTDANPNNDTSITGISDNLSIGYRFAGQPRITRNDHTAYTIVAGAKGALDNVWSYDFHAQYGYTSFRQVFTGDYSITKINDALNVVLDGSGNAVCASGNTGCVPLDIFKAKSVDLTQAAVDYVGVTAFKEGRTTEQVINLSFTGDLGKYGVKSPWADDGVAVALGTEYRAENLDLNVDSAYASGDISGSGGVNPPAKGSFHVIEGFGELRAPIVQDMPMFKLLSVEAGYRYANYSLAGKAEAYKASAEWAPTDDIRFRGGYNRAVRAPNIVEIFNPQTVGLASYDDPCSGATPSASAAACALTGVSAAQYGHIPDCGAAQCSELQGGNLALKPEQADTYTAGVVITPRFLPGFNLSVDYFDIKINDPIVQGIGGALILSQCMSASQFCNYIHRDPSTGSLFGLTLNNGYVINTNVNSGSIKTDGFDFAANYRLPLSTFGADNWGSLQINMIGTYTNSYITQPVTGLGSYDCAGVYGLVCLEPVPQWKHQARLTWNTPWNAAISVNWRYLGSVKLDLNTTDPYLAAYGVGFNDSIDGVIPAYSYFDLAGTWRVTDMVSLRAGVNNLFDKDPPVVDANNIGIAGTSAYGNGNTFPGVYDTLGRTVFVGLTANF